MEDAQSQLRAENGIKEKVIGYIGSAEEYHDVLEFDSRVVPTTKSKELPPDVKWIYFAEIHRLKTGEVLTAAQYKAKFGNVADHGAM